MLEGIVEPVFKNVPLMHSFFQLSYNHRQFWNFWNSDSVPIALKHSLYSALIFLRNSIKNGWMASIFANNFFPQTYKLCMTFRRLNFVSHLSLAENRAENILRSFGWRCANIFFAFKVGPFDVQFLERWSTNNLYNLFFISGNFDLCKVFFSNLQSKFITSFQNCPLREL